MVQETVPFTEHFTLPPTPMTATLHFVTVPGKKSLLELVKHLEEQLSMAISWESESNAVSLPCDAATMHVIVIRRKLRA
jgi:hypothetical protein